MELCRKQVSDPSVTKIKDVSNDESLSFLNDIDRNLILSEGRSKLGEWWNFKPRN